MDTVQPQADLDIATDTVTRSVDTPVQHPADHFTDDDNFLDSDSETDALLLANNKFDHPYSDSHVNDDGCRAGSSRGHSTGAGSLRGHSDDYRGGSHTHVVGHSVVTRGRTRPHEARLSYNEITRAKSCPHEACHSNNIKVVAFPLAEPGAEPPTVTTGAEPPKSSTSLTRCGKDKELKLMDINSLHVRMNHQGSKGLRKLAKRLGYKLVGSLDNCIECAQGKARRNPFYKRRKLRRFGGGECWDLDCQGPFEVQARLKHRYAVTGVEDHSGLVVIWLLPKRSDQWACLQNLLPWAHTQTGIRTKTIRADGEWIAPAPVPGCGAAEGVGL